MKLSFARLFQGSSISLRAGLATLAAISLLFISDTSWARQAPTPAATPAPIVLTGADMRPATSLNGEWHTIVDPYFNGFPGYSRNQKPEPGGRVVEYDFSKSPTLKVPGDWNTQRDSLLYYEGPIWYERDFTYQPKEHTHIFLHIGAANYKSWFWVNGTKVCEHEGGFTSFNCEVTGAVHGGDNFVVAAVDNTRHEDGVPTLKTDWWNYGGLTRNVSLIEVPEAGMRVCAVRYGYGSEKDLARWSPETPKLYKIKVRAGEDSVEDMVGFRTIETRGNEILLNGKPIFLRGVCIHAEAPYRSGRVYSDKDAETLLGWATIHTMNPCCALPTAWDCLSGQRFPCIGPSSSITPKCWLKPSSSWMKK